MYVPDLPVINVSRDIDHRTRIHLIHLLRDMQANRYTKNEALEKYKKEREDKKASYPEPAQDKKRYHPDNADPDKGQKKRVTVRDALSEIDMFQTEHLNLRKEVDLQKRLIGNLHRRLKELETKFNNHISMDGSSADAASIGSALLSLSSNQLDPTPKDDIEEVEKMCLACNKAVSLCKCFDD